MRAGFVCLGPSAVPVCASVVLSRSLLCVRWLVLCGVGCWAWLSSAVSWWVLVLCSRGAVLVWPRGSPPCGLASCVLVFRCPVLSSVALCCRVVLWSCSVVCLRRRCRLLFVSCRCASAVCVLCVFWGVVLCVPCPLCPVRCLAALCWCPFIVLCTLSVLFLVAGVVGSWCRCLLLGVCWWLWLPGVVVWWCVSALQPVSGPAVAQPLPCRVLLPCGVSRGAVLPCGAVLWCPVFFCCFSPCRWHWFPVVPCWFRAPGRFRVVSVSVLCLCGAVLVCLRRCCVWCFLALAGLDGVLCGCLLCSCVCCLAWLSSVVSCWVLVAPGVVSRWRAVVCPWVLCCGVLLRVVPPGVALLWAVLFRFAPFGAAARCVVSWGAVRRLHI